MPYGDMRGLLCAGTIEDRREPRPVPENAIVIPRVLDVEQSLNIMAMDMGRT